MPAPTVNRLTPNMPAAIIWQESEHENSEQALLVRAWGSDLITITQDDRDINLNHSTVAELCKLLKLWTQRN